MKQTVLIQFLEEYMGLSNIIFTDLNDEYESIEQLKYDRLSKIDYNDISKRKEIENWILSMKIRALIEHYNKHQDVFSKISIRMKKVLSWNPQATRECQLTLGKYADNLSVFELYANHIVGSDCLKKKKLDEELITGIKRR